MSQTTLIIHVVPIQVSLTGGSATITCNDSRAALVGEEIEFTLNPLHTLDPAVQQRVRFVVDDPADTTGYDNYLNMSSAPPLERLLAWKRSGETSRSPEMLTGHDFEVVAVAYGVPRAGSRPSTAVQLGHGRRRFKLRDAGAGGRDIY